NMEKVLIRPTAFKPVVPKNRHSVQYLSPRPGGNTLSESQASLNLLLPLGAPNSTSGTNCNIGSCSSSSEGKPNLYSGGRNARSSQSCSMSDSGRNSLSSLPTQSSTVYSLAPSEGSSSGSGSGGPVEPVSALVRNTSGGSGSHGHSNSDSGRSSSSKSTGSGSLSGRGKPLSDSGSCGHSPPPVEGYEVVVKELEEKLRERDLELQQLRENLDENEAAICQVCQKSGEISLLKQQLKEIQSELSQKAGEIVVLKAQLREARSELQASQARSQEAQTALRTRSLELEVCENELQRRKSEAELLREKVSRLEDESGWLRDTLSNHGGKLTKKGLAMGTLQQGRVVMGRGGPSPYMYHDGEDGYLVWGGESDEAKAQRQNTETLMGLRQQVIRYQKQLQQNYVQMYRRNRDLERVMRELSLELENRDMEDYEIRSGSNDIHFEEITATEI
ncbi:hypothetical protein XENOCAPTIV_017460, partial [Xenoophorus captivus]